MRVIISLLLSIYVMLFFIMNSCNEKQLKNKAVKAPIKPGFKVVGYLDSRGFDRINSIEFDKLTHLNLAFANPDSLGRIIFVGNKDIKPVVKKGHDANLKVLISLAGAGGGRIHKEDWAREMHPDNRKKLVDRLVQFVIDNNLDGIDVDIEKNLQSVEVIGENYNEFVIELKEALDKKGKIITTALNPVAVHPCVSQESLNAYDFINVMAYDKVGWWNPNKIIPGHHSPYSYAEDAYKYWAWELKIPEEKLVLGMPFYGRDFDSLKFVLYDEIVKRNVFNAYTDSINRLYYNGIPTIVRKTELAKEKFGGVMFWNLGYDMYNDLSLLRIVDQTLNAGDCKVSIFFRDADGDGYGDPTKPFCACSAPEGYVLNRDDKNDKEVKKF